MWLNTVTEYAGVSSAMADVSGMKRRGDEHIEITRQRMMYNAICELLLEYVRLIAYFENNSPSVY